MVAGRSCLDVVRAVWTGLLFMIGKCLISFLQAGVATGKGVSLSVVKLSGSGDESPGSVLLT